jgi:hypothetical protein
MKYNDFLKAQAGSSVTQFWGPVFAEWFRRFPEELAIVGEAPEVYNSIRVKLSWTGDSTLVHQNALVQMVAW